MIALIDNYDSFTYNLWQMLGTIEPDLKVFRNDEKTPQQIIDLQPDGIVISPGPGRPEDAGICIDLIHAVKGKIPLLGVCLGEQAICTAYGAVVTYAPKLMHGKQSQTKLDLTSPLFQSLAEQIPVARYHSLAVDPTTLPQTLRRTAAADDGTIMAVEDRDNRIFGLQFHPESILTPDGETILRNFIALTKGEKHG